VVSSPRTGAEPSWPAEPRPGPPYGAPYRAVPAAGVPTVLVSFVEPAAPALIVAASTPPATAPAASMPAARARLPRRGVVEVISDLLPIGGLVGRLGYETRRQPWTEDGPRLPTV